jgi:putative aldouronate transport system permease protein
MERSGARINEPVHTPVQKSVLSRIWGLRVSSGDRMFSMLTYIFIFCMTLFCLFPFWLVVVGSFTDESSLKTIGFQVFPDKWSISAYQYLFSANQVFKSYAVTITVTVVGTSLALFITSMFAYVLSHRKVKYRNIMSFLTYFTMLFGAGLVGFYILIVNWLGLKDSLWALILPYLLNPFYAFILVSFFRTLPYEIYESATVDGANDIYIFYRIICPIATPALATIGLFYALNYWNDWWLALLFVDNHNLHPLQIMIRELLSKINIESYMNGAVSVQEIPPAYGVQFASVCVTIGPIILLYPFLQRYFVKGLTIGAIKG